MNRFKKLEVYIKIYRSIYKYIKNSSFLNLLIFICFIQKSFIEGQTGIDKEHKRNDDKSKLSSEHQNS